MYQPGDLLLVPFPFSDMQTAKRRPVFVLTGPDKFDDLTCLAVTSKPHHAEVYALQESDFLQGTLPKPSWIRIDKIYTLNKVMIVGKFGMLHQESIQVIRELFCKHFDCDVLYPTEYHKASIE